MQSLSDDVRLQAAMRPRGRILLAARGRELLSVAQPDVGLVLWRRALPRALKSGLEASQLDGLSCGRVTCRVAAVRQSLAQVLASQPAGSLLAADVARLAVRFALASGSGWVRLRLEAISGDACKLFHADHVPLRLVTTYCGTGTQYLPPEAVTLDGKRAALDLSRMRTLAPGSVALFKGMTAGAAAPVVLHRSPPLSGTGESRLVLVIDRADPP